MIHKTPEQYVNEIDKLRDHLLQCLQNGISAILLVDEFEDLPSSVRKHGMVAKPSYAQRQTALREAKSIWLQKFNGHAPSSR